MQVGRCACHTCMLVVCPRKGGAAGGMCRGWAQRARRLERRGQQMCAALQAASPPAAGPPACSPARRCIARTLDPTQHLPGPPAPPAGIIDEREAATVMGHIEPHDFPEQVSTYQQMAAAAGFAGAECLHTDAREFGRLVVLSKRE